MLDEVRYYDTVIKMAIFAYDKNGFPADIDEKGRHMCAIIKDAHNLDSFQVIQNITIPDFARRLPLLTPNGTLRPMVMAIINLYSDIHHVDL